MSTTTDADELAQIISQLSAAERELLAEFVDALQRRDGGEDVAAFKARLVGADPQRKEAARQEAYDDMDLAEQKRAFFGLGTDADEADAGHADAGEEFLRGAARDL